MGKGRAPCCDKSKVKKGPWSPQEDLRLINFIEKHGHSNWRSLPTQAGLLRCGKSCRLRWINYLRPDLKRGNFTKEDEEAIIKLHHKLGNKWSKIASCFPGRTDNEIKNVWHTHLKKKLDQKDHINGHKDIETKELSKSSSFSSSSSSISPISPIRKKDMCDGMQGKKQENHDELKENLTSSNSSTTDFLIDYTYQENYEMFLIPDQDIGIFPIDIDFDFLEMFDKEDPIYTDQLQIEREDECMQLMKNLENELMLETMVDQNLSKDPCGQFMSSP